MKIRTKLTLYIALLITGAILLTSIIFLFFSKATVTDSLKNQAISDYEILVKQLFEDSSMYTGEDEIVRNSYFNYQCTLLDKNNEMVLQTDEQMIYNNIGIDPVKVLKHTEARVESEDETEIRSDYITMEDTTYCIVKFSSTFGTNEMLTFSFVRDVTQVFTELETLGITCIVIGILVVISAVLGVYGVIRRAFSPLYKLQEGAKELGAGQYNKRISIEGETEISELAENFNQMASAIETHLLEVETTSEERKLLLAALSHEMKTPVTAISGCSYSLTHINLPQDQIYEQIDFIDKECRRLERLSCKLAQLISLQGEGLDIKPVMPSVLLEEVCTILEPIAKQHNIVLSCKQDQQPLLIEHDLIVCLITNLFDNARKADATVVEIIVENKNISVIDNGKGIPKEKIPDIVKPFYVLDCSRTKEGFGLGLALVHRIVALHNGTLHIESELETGTNVSINL